MTNANTSRIRELNDQFRTTGHGGRIFLTKGIMALPELPPISTGQSA